MTLLSPFALARCLGSRDLDGLRAHLLAGGDPNARALSPTRPGDPAGGLWLVGDGLLHAAIHLGWPAGVRALLDAGADPEGLSTARFEVRTPLGRALQVNGPWQSTPRHPLLDEGTPMSWAATGQARQACLNALIEAGASVHRKVDGSGPVIEPCAMDPMRVASTHRLFEAWVRLQQAGRSPDDPVVLEQTVVEGRVRWVIHWLVAGVPADTVLQPVPGHTALHLACRSRHADAPRLVAALLEHGDPNLATRAGERPFHLALANARHGAALVKLLLDAGADPALPGAHGDGMAQRCEALLQGNPLHAVARAFEHHSLVRMADQAVADVGGRTAPTVARRRV